MLPKAKMIYLFWIVLLISRSGLSQVTPAYEEAHDPHPDKNAQWSQIPKGLQASLSNPLLKYSKGAIPLPSHQDTWNAQGWKGERVFTQIIMWSADSVDKVECAFSDFLSPSSELFPGSIATAQYVRNVLTDEFGGGCDKRKPEDFQVSLVSDVLDTIRFISISPQTSRSVWLTIDIPPAARPGIYNGKVSLLIQGKVSKEFTIVIEVIDQDLPVSSEWKFYLDMWQNPYSVSRYHQVKPWSNEHWQLLRPLMSMLANAGQKTITTTINKRPWVPRPKIPMKVW